METSGPTSGIPQLLNSLTTRTTALQLQVGQQLQAVVLDNTAGRILLSLGHRQVSAESSLPFERGQALTLKVLGLGDQPVLKVITALQESPATMAVRLLLPRHGASTPLLANLAELAKSPTAPVPPLVREAARTLVAELPGSRQLTTAAGLRDAIARSGLLLEHKLAQPATPGADRATAPVTLTTDFKANLVRLVQLVRQWPGGSQPPATANSAPAGGAAASAAVASPPLATPPAANPTTSPAPPAATSNTPAGGNAPHSPPAPGTSADSVKLPPAATPEQLRNAAQLAGTSLPARPGATGATPPGTSATASTGQPATAAAAPATGSGLTPPPPFPGVIPLPQAAVQANLDLLNRIGHLRTDLLKQTEAALARVQLSQLASLPREAERGLVEWLFDIPVRRNDEIDFWSARFLRDSHSQKDSDQGNNASWTVQLAFDLPGLGPMQAQVSLQGERVSTRFWATQADTLPLLRDHLPDLRQSMDEVGLEVGTIDCQAGEIQGSGKPPSSPLIREKV